MAGKSKQPKLQLIPEEILQLERLRDSQTASWREVQRARILLRYHTGESVSQIASAVHMTRTSVGQWIGRALAVGASAALKDAYHRPKGPSITEDAKAWVVHLACCQPKELGYAAEVWSRSALARHVREHAVEAGYPSLNEPPKPPCSGFWQHSHCIRRGSSITWNDEIRSLKPRWKPSLAR